MGTEKTRCPACGRINSEREIVLYRGLIICLWRVYCWCLQKGIHEFTRKDIKHLFTNENDTARFGDLVLFGGLVYKTGKLKAHFGLNMERCDEFFAGARIIPLTLWKNPITGELRVGKYGTISNVPDLMSCLDKDGDYTARYRPAVIHNPQLIV